MFYEAVNDASVCMLRALCGFISTEDVKMMFDGVSGSQRDTSSALGFFLKYRAKKDVILC